jgi:hypothetical protein
MKVSNPDTGLAKARYRGVFQIPPSRSAIGENWLGFGGFRGTDLAQKVVSWRIRPAFQDSIKLDQGQRNYGDTMALAGPVTHKRHEKRTGEGMRLYCVSYLYEEKRVHR